MTSGRRYTALLPMKGNSERVPNKNLRLLCGRPLFTYVLETLLQCAVIDRVVVNTDSAEIARQVQAVGGVRVVVHDRPDSIRGDFVSMNRIIEDDLSRLTGDHFLQTHSTNPFLQAHTILAALAALEASETHDSLFTVSRIQARCFTVDGKPVNHDPALMLRTQDLAPVLVENSNLYVFSRQSFGIEGRRIGRAPLMFPMSPLEAQDIDEPEDFAASELLLPHAHTVLRRPSS